MLRSFTTIAVLTAILNTTSHAQEWTRFRGPNGTGVSTATTIPVKWNADGFRWKIPLPGKGHGSQVVWGDRLFVNAERDEGRTRVVMFLRSVSGLYAVGGE